MEIWGIRKGYVGGWYICLYPRYVGFVPLEYANSPPIPHQAPSIVGTTDRHTRFSYFFPYLATFLAYQPPNYVTKTIIQGQMYMITASQTNSNWPITQA